MSDRYHGTIFDTSKSVADTLGSIGDRSVLPAELLKVSLAGPNVLPTAPGVSAIIPDIGGSAGAVSDTPVTVTHIYGSVARLVQERDVVAGAFS